MQEFDAIYRAYHDDIYRFILKLALYNADLAEELTQETFFQAYLSIDHFAGRCHIRTWLCGIAKNTYFHYLRKHRREQPLAADSTLAVGPADMEAFEETRAVGDTLRVIHALEEPGRAVVIYRLFLDMPYAQIAALLGISEASARVLFYRSKKEMQNRMRSEYHYEL